MGIGLFSSSRGCGCRTSSGIRVGSSSAGRAPALLPGDPNPDRFEIQSLEQLGAFCVAVIRWPDAMNFEGRKIAVYRATAEQLRLATRLDPHFQEVSKPGDLVPIARFEPTGRGVELARLVAMGLNQSEREALGD